MAVDADPSGISGSNDLTFNGRVTVANGESTLTVTNTGLTTFGGGIRLRDDGSVVAGTLTLAGTGNITISSVIENGSSGNGIMVYNGTGTTLVSGNNTYSGNTTVGNGATLELGNSNALGFGGISQVVAQTTITAGGTLDLHGQTGVNSALVLNGSGVGGVGALINSNAGTTATIGSGLATIGIGSIGHDDINGQQGSGYTDGTYAVTFTGGGGSGATAVATVTGGSVTSVQMTSAGSGYTTSPTATLTGAGPGTGALFFAGASSITLNSASTVGGAGNILVNASIVGPSSLSTLTKTGSGTLTLAGTNTYVGATTVSQGGLIVNGSLRSAVTVNGGVFGGTGSSNLAIIVNSGGMLTGATAGSVGTFTTTGALTLNTGSIYQADFSPSTGLFDRVAANGLTLSGATLSLNGLGSGNAIGLGNSFVILDNTGSGAISGTFAGLSQGSSITADGYSFTISYVGGTGNDVALTETGFSAVPEPSAYAAFAGGAALLAALLRRRARAA